MPPFEYHANPHLHNLPAARTSFIGCEPAIVKIKTLLRRARLLTLTGSGGSGKTRLALAVAQSAVENIIESGVESRPESVTESALVDFPAGVAWVDLAPLAEPGLVPQTIADALHLREQPQRTFTDLIIDHLCDRPMLLVLDNCEHLRAACAELLTKILQAGSLARVLATSREPLAVEGEEVWLVPMLSLPPESGHGTGYGNGHDAVSPQRLAALLQSEAVRLFQERARAVAPTFTLNGHNAEAVAQICRRLDGMPLAIELAAARANVLMPKQILDRLDNSMHLLTRGAHVNAARHQTLRAALDWSFDLLDSKEQAFFTRLSIFAGSFGVDAVEGICAGEGLAAGELLDLLANLVEKSLVVTLEEGDAQYQEMRYRLLVPIRHYAAEQLRAAGKESLWRARHADWYLDLAKRAAPELEGADQSYWLDRLESEHDNLRAALAWYAAAPPKIKEGAGEQGLQLSCAIGVFWCIRSYLSEGQRWLERYLHEVSPDTAQQSQVDALNFLARLSILQSNFQAARVYYERSLELGRSIEYDEGVETGLIGSGIALWELGDFHKARSVLEEAILYARSVGHLKSLARALNNLGLVCMHQGDNAATRAYLNECLAINQQLGHKTGIATVLFNLAMMAGHDGDFGRARSLYEESLALDRELGNRTTTADALNNMGALAVAQGDLAVAATHFQEAAQIYREVGAIGDTAYTSTGLGDIAFYNGDYGAARARYSEALGLFREASNQRLIGRVLGQLGRIACREGDLAAAAAFCGEALTIRRTIGHKPGMIFILDQGFVELALATTQPVIAARLLGAVATARKAIHRPRDPMETRQLEPHLARLRDQLGDAALAAAWAEGEAMNLDQVAAYALDTLSPATVVQARPELRVFALGQARVYRGDHLLTTAEWTYAKARELFFYLLSRPNSTREQIGLDFWPDASAEQVRKRFSAALAHARNALGREAEWILLDDGRYRIDPKRTYWFDVELFETKWHAANQLRQNGAPHHQIIALLTEAINLYQGDFAGEFVEGEWHQARRIALSRSYLDALLILGELHVEDERYPQAIAAYQQALAKDPYLEEAHHELIRCFARTGKRSQALRQFETLTTVLAELNATPSTETQAMIEHLRLGEQI
jgi:non-specific serine/threonine protein kinase